jgi:hypothetical protein
MFHFRDFGSYHSHHFRVQTGFGLMTGFIGLFDTARDYNFHFTVAQILVSTVTSSLPLHGSGFQRRTLPFLWVPELSLASATSFSYQQFRTTEQLTRFLCFSEIVAVETCLFVEPLLSNDYYILAYFAAVV